MKKIELPIYQSQEKYFFKTIRSRTDVIELWMHTIKLLLSGLTINGAKNVGKILFPVENMNRIFVFNANKLFSLYFPFKIHNHNAMYSVYTKSGIQIDSKISSDIIFIVSNIYNKFNLSLNSIIDYQLDYYESLNILIDLFMCECGYIRFDHDINHENGHIHPRYHFDICYSQGATYKLGIDRRVSFELFADILNINTPCHYLVDPEKR